MWLFGDGFAFCLNTWKVDWRVIWRWWVIWTAWWGWRWLLFLLFINFFEFGWNYAHLFDGLVVHIIPPFVFPVHWLVLTFHSKTQTVISSSDLNTICWSLLFLTKSVSFLPSHLRHEFLGVFTFKFSVRNTWWLQKSLSVFGWHIFSTIKNDYKF